MRALRTLWNKITSAFETGSRTDTPPPVERETTTSPNAKPVDTEQYSTKIGDVTYVTTAQAQKLLRDKKLAPPSDEMKQITGDAMIEQMIKQSRANIVEDWKGESDWSRQDLHMILGSPSQADKLADSCKEEFEDAVASDKSSVSPLRVDSSQEVKDKFEADKSEIKKQIPSKQTSRQASLKRAKKSKKTTKSKRTK